MTTFPTFTPSVAPETTSNKPKVRVLQADFGDGYSQRAADGINSIGNVVALSWPVLSLTMSDMIEDFLRARKGVEAFLWTQPGKSVARKWICQDWQVDDVAFGRRSVTATFTEVFDL